MVAYETGAVLTLSDASADVVVGRAQVLDGAAEGVGAGVAVGPRVDVVLEGGSGAGVGGALVHVEEGRVLMGWAWVRLRNPPSISFWTPFFFLDSENLNETSPTKLFSCFFLSCEFAKIKTPGDFKF